MTSLLILIDTIIGLYIWIIIASAVLSWLVAFNVVNPSNQFVRMLGETLWRLTEPALAPIRRVLPSLGGLDISPVVLILGLVFLRNILFEYWPR
jgi:YggT family protein